LTNLTRKTRRVFLLVVFTPLLLGVVVASAFASYQQGQSWVAHTNEVISTVDRLLLAVTRAESAQRGFLLAGNEAYNARLTKAAADSETELSHLLALTTDNATQHQNARTMKARVEERLQGLAVLVAKRQAGPLESETTALVMADGTAVMQSIWELSREITRYEKDLLASRQSSVRLAGYVVIGSFAICTLVTIGLLLWAYELIKHYAADRERAQAEVMLLNADLEKRVAARTADLEAAVNNLQRSNEDLTKFAYVASHDLQEPLRTVASYVSLLSMKYTGQIDEQADKYIRFAVEGSKRMQTLVHDLLTYSRVGTGTIKVTNVDMNKVLRDARQNLDVLISENHVAIAASVLPTLVADEGRMLQVFNNLIANAIKFRHLSRPCCISIEAEQQSSDWVFQVKDNGIGFEQQYSDRIFTLFQRLHSIGAYPGTGIGLAVCKRIVEQHGGRMWATSTLGEGSTFFFALPSKSKELEAQPETTAVKPAHLKVEAIA
jgi:signal transduction histidine kinase